MAEEYSQEGEPDLEQEQTGDLNRSANYSANYSANAESASRTATDEPVGSPVAEPVVVVEDQGCVMMGVVKSGKTTLLTAIKRACDQPARDDLSLEFIPGAETAKAIKVAIDKITGKERGHQATGAVGTFPFEVHVTGKAPNFWTPPLEAELHVVLSDGGGEFLIPSTSDSKYETERQTLINNALKAQSLVLCVDITNPGSATLEKELPITFAEMARPVPMESQVHWTERVKTRIQRRPAPQPQRRTRKCLNVDRFLLLLTQVDKISSQLPDSAGAIKFAEMIDPVAQARELLGITVLRTIRSFLRPSARLAVGKISAMGFHPVTGDPFADTDGTPLDLHTESGENVLRRWTPYGIRDAIYFLATRKCRGTVKELMLADLEIGSELLEFSYSSPAPGGKPRHE